MLNTVATDTHQTCQAEVTLSRPQLTGRFMVMENTRTYRFGD